MSARADRRFVEVQYFPIWAVIALLGSGLLILAVWLSGVGSRPISGAMAIGVAALLAGLFVLLFRMRTEVGGDFVEVVFGWLGLVRFRIPVAAIARCRPVDYRPLREFGGWGIRFALDGRRAYSTRGDRAAEIVTSERTILIGSEAPERLCAAIESVRGAVV